MLTFTPTLTFAPIVTAKLFAAVLIAMGAPTIHYAVGAPGTSSAVEGYQLVQLVDGYMCGEETKGPLVKLNHGRAAIWCVKP
jgi:hypothetical protein